MTPDPHIVQRIKPFEVTRESIKGELPDWLTRSGFGDGGHYWMYATKSGDWGQYLVQPYPDEPDHIEVWAPEQVAARVKGNPYEAMKRAKEIIDDNLYHQREKVEDASRILDEAIRKLGETNDPR